MTVRGWLMELGGEGVRGDGGCLGFLRLVEMVMVVMVGWLGEEGNVESMEMVVPRRCDFSFHFRVVRADRAAVSSSRGSYSL